MAAMIIILMSTMIFAPTGKTVVFPNHLKKFSIGFDLRSPRPQLTSTYLCSILSSTLQNSTNFVIGKDPFNNYAESRRSLTQDFLFSRLRHTTFIL